MDVQITIAINSRLLSNVVNGEICVSTKRRISVSINNYRGIFFTIATKSELEASFISSFEMQFHPSSKREISKF